jgi:hypothetical protein
MSTPDGWGGLLDADEKIVWQGRPDDKIALRAGNILLAVFGLIFAGFALLWMIIASGSGGYFWMFGLIHFFVGLGLSFGAIFWGGWRRRHTWYTLSNRRAFIATDLPIRGKRLKSFPITANTVLDYRKGQPATIIFGQELRNSNNSTHKVDIGFERIDDGREVYRMMRDIQKGNR